MRLVSLSDLRTESEHVRATLAQYLNKLLGYGVSGFRVDAAKHLGQADLAAIESRLNPTVDGRRPSIALEVPPGGPGKLSPWAFRSVGDLLGFDFATLARRRSSDARISCPTVVRDVTPGRRVAGLSSRIWMATVTTDFATGGWFSGAADRLGPVRQGRSGTSVRSRPTGSHVVGLRSRSRTSTATAILTSSPWATIAPGRSRAW